MDSSGEKQNGGRFGPEAVQADAEAPADAFHAAGTAAREGFEYVSYFIAAKLDAIKTTGRKIGLLAVMGILGLVLAIGVVATATVLLVVGISGGIGTLLGHNWWLGAIVTGVIVIGGIGAAAFVAYKKMSTAFKQGTVEKYENRRRQQRADFGHDVHDRAASRA